MKVKNVSARLHHVGNVSIAPGDEGEIDDKFAKAINTEELVPVDVAKRAKKQPAADETPVTE